MDSDENFSNASESSPNTPTDDQAADQETLSGGEFVYRAIDPEDLSITEQGDAGTVIEGRMMPYNEWTEIRSSIEGHFLERFTPGSLAKTMVEQAHRVRAMFEHGFDATLGRQLIATVDEMREQDDGAYFRATLLDGVPKLLVEGIRKGLYGSSVRFKPVKYDRVRHPARTDHNPDGIEEITVREAFMKEFSVTPFPQYAGATAKVRSITDEIAARQLLGDPKRLLEIISSEPQHSPPEAQEDPVAEGSRSTQPIHDYLRPQEDDSSWMV